MPYVTNTSGTFKPNFLDSEVGLVSKTYEIPANMGVMDDDGIHKTVAAGTPYPADGSTAIGIVYQDVDVTYGDRAGAVLVAGRVLTDRLSITEDAKTALTDAGIVFVDAAETTR
jgi:hypothetical protein